MRYVAALLVLVGCGRIGFDASGGVGDGGGGDGGDGGDVDAAASCTTWGPPVRIAELASAADDYESSLHPDGSLLVMSSYRTGPSLLYVSTLQGGTWSTPTHEAVLSGVSQSYGPSWNAAGDRLYFASDRSGEMRIYVAAFDGLDFAAPSLAPGLTGVEGEAPYVTSNEQEMVFSTPALPGPVRLMRAGRATALDPWGAVELIAELDVPVGNGWPTITADGLTLYFERDTGVTTDIYRATRPTRDAPFAPGTIVTELSSADEDGDPELTRDGRTMLMASKRGTGDADIYIAACL